MAAWQFGSWVLRFASYWALLDAFHIGGSVRNALLVLAVQVVASVFPFTPGGAGVQQAFLLTIFAHSTYVAAFSVGQQIATAALTTALGFGALVLIFRFRSFREVDPARARASAGRKRGSGPRRGRASMSGPDAHASAATTTWSRTARSARVSSRWRCARWSARALHAAPRPVRRPRPGRPGARRQGPAPPDPAYACGRLVRGSDDGYRSPLVPGLKSSDEAERLAEDIALGATRLEMLAQDPPGLYAEIADASGDLEERTWLAFLVAYIGPREAEDPFANIAAVRTPWAGGGLPDPDAIEPGPRGAHDAGRGTRTLDAYRAWAARSGSQAAAIAGEPVWPAPRRFARAFERLALPGFHRDARFELLVTLGALGVYELEAASLALGGDNSVSVGAKRALGIGDPLLLDRRATELGRRLRGAAGRARSRPA